MNVELQVIGYALRAVAEEMGAVLVRSSFSPNVKERRDCSTAVFDPDGRLIAQAEHIPVHLGAMPDAVAAVRDAGIREGETWILNDPFRGGTHLNDITLVTRVPSGFVVNRAHHADVGGIEPGSMPPSATRLEEEGVVIAPEPLTPALVAQLASRMRNPDERRGDLRAQSAAQRAGAQRLEELCTRYGRAVVVAAMEELYDYSDRAVRAALARLPEGTWDAEDVLEAPEGELRVRVRAHVRGGGISFDFAGTAPQHEGNLNCPLAVTRSACYFVVRCITEPDLPGSGGAFAPVEVSAPAGCLVNAQAPAAVSAGNTETSSRIVDLCFRALGHALAVPAEGQGTMNNVLLGNDRFAYYETIAGGQGACADADGPSAVHVAMTNTLNTPVEALELAYPLRVERYSLRIGSGGEGTRRGGDGVVRELRALDDCRLSIVSERRRAAPRGRDGGGDGAPGRNLLNGVELPAKATVDVTAGDVIAIETPGGGGYGRVSEVRRLPGKRAEPLGS